MQGTAYAAGQTQIWGGKLLSGFISCGISDFGGGLAKLMLRVKRADGSTFHSDAIREKLRGSDVALDGSVVHTVGKVFIAQLTLLSDCGTVKDSGCVRRLCW